MTKPLDRTRTLGVTVLGDFILSEGVEPILDNLERAHVTAVACNPTVTAAAAEGEGSFQPPADAGSSPRLFDRPLFGKRALWVTSAPSYHPDPQHYAGCAYSPRKPKPLTDEHGDLIREFIDAALARGMKVYFQVGAAQPSGLRDVDRPRLPNGDIPSDRMADTASLASDDVRAYNRAYTRDLLAQYPQINGFRIDWPEYPCYTLGEVFQDFSPHVASWAAKHDFDFAAIRAAVGDYYDLLHGGLTNEDLQPFADAKRLLWAVETLLDRYPRIWDWHNLKMALSVDIIRDWRDILSECSETLELVAHAFMPPYADLTGFDFTQASQHCDVIAPKLYTMHWSLMLKFWGDELLAHNSGLDERVLVRALANLMDIADPDAAREKIADYGYPEPHEPHFIPDEPQRQKIRLVIQAVNQGTSVPVSPMVHGYGPTDDFLHRFEIAAKSECPIVWINRYGYLSDEKLAGLSRIKWS